LYGAVSTLVAPSSEYGKLQRHACPWTFTQMQLIRGSLQNLRLDKATETLQVLLSNLKFDALRLPVNIPIILTSVSLRYGRPFRQVTNSKFFAPWILQLHHFCRHLNCVLQPDDGNRISKSLDLWRSDLKKRLGNLEPGCDFQVNTYELLTYLHVGVLILIVQCFETSTLVEVTPQGCQFVFKKFKRAGSDLEFALNADFFYNGLQLVEAVPIPCLCKYSFSYY
jgi:hypothetical protein